MLEFIINHHQVIIAIISTSAFGYIVKLIADAYNERAKYRQKKTDEKENESVKGGGLVIGTLPGCVSAPGFNEMPVDFNELNELSWNLQIKIVNPGKQGVCIMGAGAEFIGYSGYGAISNYSDIYSISRPTYEEPQEYDMVNFPIIIYPESEVLFYIKFGLQTYKRKLLLFKKPVSFKREDIRLELYEKIRIKQKIAIRTDRGLVTQHL